MGSYDGLGKNRKFGFDKEDGPNKRTIDIDLILEKLETQLKKKPERDILVKCQDILDKLADKYNGKCTKKQLSRMYKIQGKIFEYSGEKKLAKRYKYQAQESRKDYGLRKDLFIVFIVIGIIIVVICLFMGLEDEKRREQDKLEKCLEQASARATFSGDSENELSIKCYREHKVDNSEAKIKELQEKANRSQQEKMREEQKQEKDEEYVKQYMLEQEKKRVHCNTTYNGYSADTNCY